MWTFEQMQTLALSSVATTVRMTIVKLASGGLWIHSPIAPTRCFHQKYYSPQALQLPGI